jgi:hypothetical protein
VSKEMLEVALLSTVRAEALPLAAPPTLLGVVLPECESLGLGEKMFTNWRVGGDITQSAMRNEHFLSKYFFVRRNKRFFSTTIFREEPKNSTVLGWPLEAILESLIFWLRNDVFRVPCPDIEAPKK